MIFKLIPSGPFLQVLLFIFLAISSAYSFKIEGRVFLPDEDTLTQVQVLVDDGLYKGFVRSDGRFAIYNVPTGSYVVQAHSPTYVFEPVRVDITARGSIRARKLNHLKPSAVILMKYPIEIRALGLPKYFQQREKFSVLDMLKSPMVIMMVLPMLILVVLPKLMNTSDPEVRKEMEESMKMFNPNQNQLPDMSDVFTKWFGDKNPGGNKNKKQLGSSTSATSRVGKVSKRR